MSGSGHHLAGVVIAVGALLYAGVGGAADILSPADIRIAKAAFKDVELNRATRARQTIAKASDRTLKKLFDWVDFERTGTDASFARITTFIDKNPNWPRLRRLQRRAEEAITDSDPARRIADWLTKHPPVSGYGMVGLGEARSALGQKDEGGRLIRRGWIAGNFAQTRERQIIRRHRRLLTRDDHGRRLERLLWDGQTSAAWRMLRYVDKDTSLLAQARIALRRKSGGVDAAIARVPQALKQHPGLVYERLRWRRGKGRYDEARDLVLAPPPDMGRRSAIWWGDRAILARDALTEGYITDAYRVAAEHGMKASSGEPFAEAEWLAGWIALRFLGDPGTAKGHFQTMFGAVTYPISRARGAYWAGRALEAAGAHADAAAWYRRGAAYVTTYYGQLAAQRLGPETLFTLPPAPAADAARAKALGDHEMATVIKIIAAIGRQDRMRPFVRALEASDPSPAWRYLAGRLASAHGRADLGVALAKRSALDGRVIVETGYPSLDLPGPRGAGVALLEKPLVLATVRQESAFYAGAKSGAGARGLMQLMPRTASRVATRLRIPYSRSRLMTDGPYNLRLGQAYLAEMVQQFSGSYVLALAAYNAGPNRAQRWIKRNGDPREVAVDVIDWVEQIPFSETRNYIQRVMENLQIYRQRLRGSEVALSLEGDLNR